MNTNRIGRQLERFGAQTTSQLLCAVSPELVSNIKRGRFSIVPLNLTNEDEWVTKMRGVLTAWGLRQLPSRCIQLLYSWHNFTNFDLESLVESVLLEVTDVLSIPDRTPGVLILLLGEQAYRSRNNKISPETYSCSEYAC